MANNSKAARIREVLTVGDTVYCNQDGAAVPATVNGIFGLFIMTSRGAFEFREHGLKWFLTMSGLEYHMSQKGNSNGKG